MWRVCRNWPPTSDKIMTLYILRNNTFERTHRHWNSTAPFTWKGTFKARHGCCTAYALEDKPVCPNRCFRRTSVWRRQLRNLTPVRGYPQRGVKQPLCRNAEVLSDILVRTCGDSSFFWDIALVPDFSGVWDEHDVVQYPSKMQQPAQVLLSVSAPGRTPPVLHCPCQRSPSWEAACCSDTQAIPYSLWMATVHHHVHNSMPSGSNLLPLGSIVIPWSCHA